MFKVKLAKRELETLQDYSALPHPETRTKIMVLKFLDQGVEWDIICKTLKITKNTLLMYLQDYQQEGIEKFLQSTSEENHSSYSSTQILSIIDTSKLTDAQPEQSASARTIASAFRVVDLMAESTDNVLDMSDKLADLVDDLEGVLQNNETAADRQIPTAQGILAALRDELFNIIASQSYQDAARQKMEIVINELKQAYEGLEDQNRFLEQRVAERTVELKQKNLKINETLRVVEEANHEIINSLQYAKRIQTSLLPRQDLIQKILPNSFFLWNPRDIVGGDIFILKEIKDGFVVGIFDCTGHGVPGALMTMIASSAIRRIVDVEHCYDPALILRKLNRNIKKSLQQDHSDTLSDDGLDAALCRVNLKHNYLVFSGARIPLYLVQQGEYHMLKGDRCSLGYKRSDLDFEFTNHQITLEKGVTFYLLTDGYKDQLGGKRRLLFGKKRLRELLCKISKLPFPAQKEKLEEVYETYRNNSPIQDDVTAVGFSLEDSFKSKF